MILPPARPAPLRLPPTSPPPLVPPVLRATRRPPAPQATPPPPAVTNPATPSPPRLTLPGDTTSSDTSGGQTTHPDDKGSGRSKASGAAGDDTAAGSDPNADASGADPNLVTEKEGGKTKMTGTGAPGSHSALFGLTPDGKVSKDVDYSGTKPQGDGAGGSDEVDAKGGGTEEKNDEKRAEEQGAGTGGDTSSRAAAGEGVKDQLVRVSFFSLLSLLVFFLLCLGRGCTSNARWLTYALRFAGYRMTHASKKRATEARQSHDYMVVVAGHTTTTVPRTATWMLARADRTTWCGARGWASIGSR